MDIDELINDLRELKREGCVEVRLCDGPNTYSIMSVYSSDEGKTAWIDIIDDKLIEE